MNLHDQECIITIAEEKNISRAAQKLSVTPSALTQLVNRVENDVGTALFSRSRSGCILTEAGHLYVDAARKILMIRRDTYHRIHDVAVCKKAELAIGFPPEHGARMLTSVFSEFQRQHPNIHLVVREASVRKQQEMLASGELDLGFMTLLDSQKTDDEYIHLIKEEVLIALPAGSAPTQFAKTEAGSRFPVLDISCLKDFPMAQLYKESTFCSWIESIFAQAHYEPKVIVEATRPSTLLRMVNAGVCGSLVTDYHSRHEFSNTNISFFCLPSHPFWYVMACYRRGSYLSKPMQTLISLAQAYWEEENQT